MAEKKYALDMKQRDKALTLIRAHAHKIGTTPAGEDVIEYEEGWNDDRVAVEVGVPLAGKAVGNARRNIIGHLIGSAAAKIVQSDSALLDMIAEQSAVITKLVAAVNAMLEGTSLEKQYRINLSA